MTPPRWGRPTARLLFGPSGVWPVRVHDPDAVPAAGAVLLASNHLGFLDGPMFVGVAPRWVQCLVKEEMFRSPFGPVLRATGADPGPPRLR